MAEYDLMGQQQGRANAILPAAIQEAAGFYADHAFESLGGALCVHHGQQPPKRQHAAKITAFQGFANAYPFAQDVATLAILVQSLRNDLLYPSDPTGGQSETPDERYSLANAQNLIADVTSSSAKSSSSFSTEDPRRQTPSLALKNY